MGRDMVRILGIAGSTRKGATTKAVRLALEAAQAVSGVSVDMIDLCDKRIEPCIHCDICLKKNTGSCVVHKDDMTDKELELYSQCHGIILGSPVYQMNPSGQLGNFLNRLRPLGHLEQTGANGMRIGGSIAVGGVRNGGQDMALSAMNCMMQAAFINIVGGGYHFYNGAAVWSQNKKNFQDEKGTSELEILGRKVAYTAKVMYAGQQALRKEVNSANYIGFETAEQLAEVTNAGKF